MSGLAIATSPKNMGAIRNARNNLLKFGRMGRDVNAVMNRQVTSRIGNRIKGRVGGLMVNAVLPKTNNLALRLVRAKVGSKMNKAIHKKMKTTSILEIYGPKATANVKKQIFAGGSIFQTIQRSLAVGLRATAPRTAFTMNIGGQIIQFAPDNLADSVYMRQPEMNPSKNVIGEWMVTVGGSTPESNIADKAPYVWIANYGGILFDPKTGENDKKYAPTFFAQRSIEGIEKIYGPMIKKIGEIFDPNGAGKLSSKEMVSVVYNARAKTMHKIWLSKDGEFQKKQTKIDKDKRRKRNKDMMYEDKYGPKKNKFKSLPAKSYQEAIDSGAEATMTYLYGDEVAKIVKKVDVKSSSVKGSKVKGHKVKGGKSRKLKGADEDGKARRSKKVRSHNRSAAERKDHIRKEHKRKITTEYDVGVDAGVGQVRIIADMRELKEGQGGKARWIAGNNNRYKNSVLEPSKVKIRRDGVYDLGSVKIDSFTDELLTEAKDKGIISFTMGKEGNIQNAVVHDIDAFEKHFDIHRGPGDRADGKFDPNAEARAKIDISQNKASIKSKINREIRENAADRQEIDRLVNKHLEGKEIKSGKLGKGKSVAKFDKTGTARVVGEENKLAELRKEKEKLKLEKDKLTQEANAKKSGINVQLSDPAAMEDASLNYAKRKMIGKEEYFVDDNGRMRFSKIDGREGPLKVKDWENRTIVTGERGKDGKLIRTSKKAKGTTNTNPLRVEIKKVDSAIEKIDTKIKDTIEADLKEFTALSNARQVKIDVEERMIQQLVEKRYIELYQGGDYFQPERVTGVSRKMKSVGRQHEDYTPKKYMGLKNTRTQPVIGEKGVQRLTFKIDQSQAALADTKGIGAFVVETQPQQLTGVGGTVRGKRGRPKIIKPVMSGPDKSGMVTLTYSDPSLPTGQLVLRANASTGKITKRGISLKTQDGTKIVNATNTRQNKTLFVKEEDGTVRRARRGEKDTLTYGVSRPGSDKFQSNELELLDDKMLDISVIEDADNVDKISDIAMLASSIEEKREKRTGYRNRSYDSSGFRIDRDQRSRGFIIRFEDF